MKKTLLTAAVLIAGIAGVEAAGGPVTVKDPATYEKNAEFNLELTSNWFVSSIAPANFLQADYPFAWNNGASRTMTYANGKLYVGRRVMGGEKNEDILGLAIDVVDASNGAFIKTVTLPDNVFKKDGALVSYPLNSLRTDSKGNLVMMNMVINAQATPSGRIQVWAMENEDATPKLILDQDPADVGKPAMRVDYFSAYGDVFTNGYIMGAVAGGDAGAANQVIKWDIVNGKIETEIEGYFDMIILQEFVPATAFNGAVINTLGGAPFVQPVSENTFYVDGQNTYPAMYNMDGAVVTGKSFTGDAPEGTAYPNTSANGVTEFKLNGASYLLAGATPHVVSGEYQKNSFTIYRLADNGSYTGMKQLFNFPKDGFGANSNSTYCLLPFVDVKSDRAEIYLWSYFNGFAKYTLNANPNSVHNDIENTNAVTAFYTNGSFNFSAEVASAEVYSIAGVKVAEVKNADVLSVVLPQGVYVVKAVSVEGAVNTQKVIVK